MPFLLLAHFTSTCFQTFPSTSSTPDPLLFRLRLYCTKEIHIYCTLHIKSTPYMLRTWKISAWLTAALLVNWRDLRNEMASILLKGRAGPTFQLSGSWPTLSIAFWFLSSVSGEAGTPWEYKHISIHAPTPAIVQPHQFSLTIMTTSALYGTPPVTEDDLWIIKGIYRFLGLTGKVDPKKGLPLRAKKPPNYVFESWGDQAVRTSAALIVLMVLITGSRLVLRATRRDLRWGLDDWAIIPAAVSCI